MKLKYWNRIMMFFSIIALSVFVTGSAMGGPKINIKAGKFETAQQKRAMHAYRMVAGYKGDNDAKLFAEHLFNKTKARQKVSLKADTANNMIYLGGAPGAFFRINRKTGDFSFSKGIGDYFKNENRTDSLPGKNQAANIAKQHLKALKLMPKYEKELTLQHVGGLGLATHKDGKTSQPVDKLVTVQFGRVIDGVPVTGPGSKIIVTLGANGELVSLQRRWVELKREQKKSKDFKSQADVHSNIKAKMAKEAAGAKRVDVNAPEFGYYDDGDGNIEPAYIFLADLTYDSEDAKAGKYEKEKYFGVVGAMKGSRAKFDQLEKAKKGPVKSTPPKQNPPKKDDQ